MLIEPSDSFLSSLITPQFGIINEYLQGTGKDFRNNEDFQISHARHRSFINGFIHIFSTLVAYIFKSNKPAIKLHYLIPS
jgi:hypothetical protein